MMTALTAPSGGFAARTTSRHLCLSFGLFLYVLGSSYVTSSGMSERAAEYKVVCTVKIVSLFDDGHIYSLGVGLTSDSSQFHLA